MFLTKIHHFFLEKMSSQNRRKSCFRASSRHNFLRRPFMVAEMGWRQSGKYVTDFFFFKVGDYVYEKMLYCIQPFSCTAKVGTFNAICLVLTKEMTQI